MEQQSIIQNNNNKVIGVPDADFHDALEESPFLNPPNSFEESDQSVTTSEHDSNKSEESTVTVISEHTPDSPSSPSSAGLRHRRSCRESSQSQFFKNNPDGLIDFDPPVKKYVRSSSSILKNNDKLNENSNSSVFHLSSNSEGRRLNDDTDVSSSSVTVDSPNSAPDLVSILLELAIKILGFQTKFLANSVTFPIWLLHASYLIMTDPLGIIKLARSYMLGNSSGILGICYSGVKLINCLGFQKHESALKLCYRVGWGLLWFAYCGFILVSLLVPAFVFGGVMMKRIVEEPVLITEKLIFDYTKDTPMAFVPVVSCPESSVVVHNQKSKIASLDESRFIPFDHEVHVTVSLTLPESDYNINLGIFQVRVDFVSSDGKLLGSIRQPCMLKFRSQPIRLVSTFFKLASLLTGYSSETQTLDLKFRGYTEKDVHTSCSRIVIEQRAEFGRRGGVPEIYSASLKIESQLPFVRRMLWYSKWLIYMWISIMMYIMELLFLLLCCRPVIFPWERSVGGSGSSNDNVSRHKPSGSM
ncbi:hypothetical protein L1987_59299 [Smallanthus sonchifolius]|uniref:Uncharacterized protein n=1 Tax=Smallanthus sonchifolius TaxID=185202 RepID=A0ACB9D542_9ASTR|nr:hypothetical protein L1987_59299 [Smallanthus sonchifolius]